MHPAILHIGHVDRTTVSKIPQYFIDPRYIAFTASGCSGHDRSCWCIYFNQRILGQRWFDQSTHHQLDHDHDLYWLPVVAENQEDGVDHDHGIGWCLQCLHFNDRGDLNGIFRQ